MTPCREILVSAQSPSEAVQRLFNLEKSRNLKFSLSLLSKRSGIGSRGYLSEIVRGKKNISPKKAEKIAKGLNLDSLEKECFQNLVLLAHSKKSSNKAELMAELELSRQALQISSMPMPSTALMKFFAFEVFCVFSLFKNEASQQQLANYFGIERKDDVVAAIAELQSWGLIKFRDEKFVVEKPFVLFHEGAAKNKHIEFLRYRLDDAKLHAAKWFSQPENALLISVMIAANSKHYQKWLEQTKSLLKKQMSKIETKRADTLLNFNVQIYPHGVHDTQFAAPSKT